MQKNYSRRDRERKKMFRVLAIALLCIVLTITAILGINQLTGNNTGKYTADQLLHDHDGDGIPEH